MGSISSSRKSRPNRVRGVDYINIEANFGPWVENWCRSEHLADENGKPSEFRLSIDCMAGADWSELIEVDASLYVATKIRRGPADIYRLEFNCDNLGCTVLHRYIVISGRRLEARGPFAVSARSGGQIREALSWEPAT